MLEVEGGVDDECVRGEGGCVVVVAGMCVLRRGEEGKGMLVAIPLSKK